MIWHIIKKDLRLLWPLAAGLAVLHALVELTRYEMLFGDPMSSGFFVLQPVASIAWIVLVVTLVHQDALPGTRQDWLTRPIKRRDLLLAKLVFLLVFLHGPLLLANTAGAVAAGFPLPHAVGAAARSGAISFVLFTVSTVALAAVTRNMTELLIAGIGIAVLVMVTQGLSAGITGYGCGSACAPTIDWIFALGQIGVFIVAAAVILGLQYLNRGATMWARWAVAAACVAFASLSHLPRSTAYGIQQAVTGGGERNIRVEIDRGPPVATPSVSEREAAAIRAARGSMAGLEPGAELTPRFLLREAADATIALPLRISGLAAGTVVWADRVEARLRAADGRVIFRGAGDDLELRADGPASQQARQTVRIPRRVLERAGSREHTLEVDFWLTSLETTSTITLPGGGGEARLASDATCSTHAPRDGRAIEVRCVSLDTPSACVEVTLEGARGPGMLACYPSYAPFQTGPQLFSRFEIRVPLPEGAVARDTVVRVAEYEARNHATSRLVVPQFRLADWTVAER